MMMDAPSSTTARSHKGADTAALESAFAAREAWAYEAAYALYRRLLFGAALGVLHDAAESEDCVHDTLVRLWRTAHSYTQARGSLAAFLAVCVRNEALSRRRKQANRLRIERERIGEGAPEEAADESVLDRERVDTALDSLSEVQRETIRLAYYGGLTHEEIARRMNEPLGTVKSRISTALRSLRAYFSARGEDV